MCSGERVPWQRVQAGPLGGRRRRVSDAYQIVEKSVAEAEVNSRCVSRGERGLS
jgi:hypothetical protein